MYKITEQLSERSFKVESTAMYGKEDVILLVPENQKELLYCLKKIAIHLNVPETEFTLSNITKREITNMLQTIDFKSGKSDLVIGIRLYIKWQDWTYEVNEDK